MKKLMIKNLLTQEKFWKENQYLIIEAKKVEKVELDMRLESQKVETLI